MSLPPLNQEPNHDNLSALLPSQVYQPRLMTWVSQKTFPTSRGDGGFPKGNPPISKEVNRKKSEAGGECLVPADGYGHHFTKINYLYSY